MSDSSSEAPTPEFRAHLEWEVTRAFRREASLGTRRLEVRRRRLRFVTIAAVCLALGTVSSFAAAQVQAGTRRDSLLDTARAKLDLLRLREQLAQKEYADVAKKASAGVVSTRDLVAIRADLQAMEARVAQARLDIEEIQAGALPPRNDLNAPMVKGRDYVKERLEVELEAVRERLAAQEQDLAEIQRQARMGMANDLSVSEQQVVTERVQRDLTLMAERLKLRQEFLQKKTPSDQLEARLDSAQRAVDLQLVIRQKELATNRLDLIQKQRAVGTASELELLKAQVEVKERELELAKLKAEADAARAAAMARGKRSGG